MLAVPSGVVQGQAQGVSLEVAESRLLSARRALEASGYEVQALEKDVTSRSVEYTHVSELVEAAGISQKNAAVALVDAKSEAGRMAAAVYVSDGSSVQTAAAMLRAPDPLVFKVRDLLSSVLAETHGRAIRNLTGAYDAADASAQKLAASLEGSRILLEEAATRLARAREEQDALRVEVNEAVDLVLEVRARLIAESSFATDQRLGIPLIALDAYQRASEWAKTSQGCDIEWWGLAGTGRAESTHGLAGGGMQANGDTVRKIRGIALDGTRSEAIRDTDGGVLDGDAVWDRAVGPTQFIPATWRGYQAAFDLDGNADGVESPDNMYDAARATAAYLCRNSTNLTTDEGLRRAYWSYNHVERYVNLCLEYARGYERIGAAAKEDVRRAVESVNAILDLPTMGERAVDAGDDSEAPERSQWTPPTIWDPAESEAPSR